MTHDPIQKRFILIGGLIAFVIVVATGVIVAMQRSAAIDAFQTATMNLGNGMSQQTKQALGSVDQSLRDIQARLTPPGTVSGEDIEARLRDGSSSELLADARSRCAYVDRFMVVDAAGRVANTSLGRPSTTIDVSDSELFKHFSARDDRGVFVGAPTENRATGRWTAPMARRVNDGQGHFAGLVIAELSLSDLQEFYHLAMPARRTVYLARRDGLVLVRYPARGGDIGRRIPDGSPWYASVAQGGGAYHAPAFFDPEPVIAWVRPLPDLPFVVEASVTETDTLAAWKWQRLWIICGGIASIGGALGLLRLFGKQYIRLAASELSLSTKNAELDAARQRLAATLANLSHGVCFYDEAMRLVVFNQKYCELYGVPSESVRAGMTLADFLKLRAVAGSLPEQSETEYLAAVDALQGEGHQRDLIVELRNGRTISVRSQRLPGRGGVSTHEDITERREAEAKIAFLARHDVLTGLANRSLLQERLALAAGRAERGEGFAVLCLDLDRFKAVNDTLGHPTGDLLLQSVADRLRAVVRDGDTIARLGGDEFAIIQHGVTAATSSTMLARRIVGALSVPFELGCHTVNIGVSIGIALGLGDGADPGQLMKNADLALYRAKEEGRGTWRFFEQAMDTLARERGALESDLRSAVALGQFELHYQPLVRGGDRAITGFEALLRWRHPTRGLVGPGEFISVAEEIGIIGEIGAWALVQACVAATEWPENIRVAVNLSARQFRDRSLLSDIAQALEISGLRPSRLELEITESVPLRDDQKTLAMLQDIQAMGARIALDDFGTGYSSLSYLRSFPFDTIKIDRSFVSDLGRVGNGGAIIGGIIGLAANLGMSVTAEGVETEAQFERLAAMGCDEIQGYLISKALPAEEIPALLTRNCRGTDGPGESRVTRGRALAKLG